MPDVVHNIVLVAHIMLAVGLIAIIILMQRSEGGMGGLGGGGGGGAGGMGGFLAGRTQANVVTRTTAILATGFFLTSLILAVADHRGRQGGPLVPDAAPISSVPSTGTPATGTSVPASTGPELGGDSGTATSPATPAAPTPPAAPSGQ